MIRITQEVCLVKSGRSYATGMQFLTRPEPPPCYWHQDTVQALPDAPPLPLLDLPAPLTLDLLPGRGQRSSLPMSIQNPRHGSSAPAPRAHFPSSRPRVQPRDRDSCPPCLICLARTLCHFFGVYRFCPPGETPAEAPPGDGTQAKKFQTKNPAGACPSWGDLSISCPPCTLFLGVPPSVAVAGL